MGRPTVSVPNVPAPLWDLDRLDPKVANALYHDAAARAYDTKWAISFDERCIRYVRQRAERMLPGRRYERVLDIGCGTGFFLLNLWLAGFVGEAHGCDISPGMIRACAEHARTIGCAVQLRVADAERLPYADETFDLVVCHAVLHHLPQPSVAMEEVRRVLRPGGLILVAGEPTRAGDRMAKAVGRWTARGIHRVASFVPVLRKPDPGGELDGDERVLRDLEWRVDLHTFEPSELAELAARSGFQEVRIETEELASSLVGWAVRTIEAEVPSGCLPRAWGPVAYRAYLALYRLDSSILARVLPQSLFYNLLLSAVKRDGKAG